MVGSRTCFHQHVVSCVDSFPLDETIHSANPHSANPRSAYTHLVNPHSVNPHLVNPHSVNPHSVNTHSVNPHLVNPHGCQHVNWKIGYNLPTHRWVKLGTYHLDKTPSIAFVGLPTESSMGKRSWAVRICLVRMCAIRVIQNSKINRIIKLKQKIELWIGANHDLCVSESIKIVLFKLCSEWMENSA